MINAHFKNQVRRRFQRERVRGKCFPDPGIAVSPRPIQWCSQPALPGCCARAPTFRLATPGIQYISFIADDGTTRTRIIKKIFVTRISFNSANRDFWREVLKAPWKLASNEFTGPKGACCCGTKTLDNGSAKGGSLLDYIRRYGSGTIPTFTSACPTTSSRTSIWEWC